MKRLFESYGSFFVTDYQGLNVADMTTLRRNLRGSNVKYLIAKNTLLKLAAKEAGVTGVDEHFVGPTAVAFTSDDPAAAAKVLYDSFKARELPRVKVFVVDQRVYGATDIRRLADLPPREVLLSQLVAAVESPLTALVGSLDGFFRELVGSLDALTEKRKGES
ncbi:MAG: 50S ribosomal protein L10 [Candidatus Zixiibacteriota bacterium]|nr:MAG: 50S ribosomal protein L10 [candidate division Zixibacteria bacterium]